MSRSALPAAGLPLWLAVLLSAAGAAEAAADTVAPAPKPPAASTPAAPTVLALPDLRLRIEEKLARQRALRAEALLRAPAALPASATASAPALAVAARPMRVAAAPKAPARSRHAPAAHAADPLHWTYGGDAGPEHWAGLKPEFATCAQGRRQSPIDIQGGLAVDLEAIRFDYQPSAFRVIDNGHTVQVNLAPGNFVAVGGRRYELQQFHFHRPSEERINGRQFDLVAHLVHRSEDGRLAVLAVLMDAGKAHPLVQQVWNNLPLEKHEEQAAPQPLDPNALLPEDRRYYTYMGSLTTPPCSEGVLWLVMKQPAALSPEQLAIFSRLYPMNARPLQAASGRLIKESN